MTHATIKPAGGSTGSPTGLCTVAFAYDAASKGWTVPTLTLPLLKGIFTTMTVDPAALADYYGLLRQMLEDFASSGLTVWLEGSQVRSKCLRKGELGKHLGEVINTHRAGIAAVLKQGRIVPRQAREQAPARVERPRPQPAPAPDPEPVTDKALEVFLKGAKNAQKKADKTAAIVKAKRRKKKETTELV